MFCRLIPVLFLSLCSLILAPYLNESQTCFALEKPGEELAKVGLDSKIGQQVDMELEFTDPNGQKKKLKEILISGKPVIFTPVYYTCPRLCGLLLGGVVKLLNALELKLGSEYQLLTVSFDPEEGPELAKERAAEYHAKINASAEAKDSWHFLVGDKENIDKLMNQVGFRYMKDSDEYAHTAVIIILTPQGEISQYFSGIDFSAWDVKLSLIEASMGKVGTFVDQLLLFCFRYDHTQGKYTLAAFNLVRAGGILTMLGLGVLVLMSSKKGNRSLG